MNSAKWADWSDGNVVSIVIRKSKKEKLPTDWNGINKHSQSVFLLEALQSECRSYWENHAVGVQEPNFDWSTIPPDQIENLMILFDKKMFPDGMYGLYDENGIMYMSYKLNDMEEILFKKFNNE